MSSVSGDFTQSEVFALIGAIRRQPCLWNPANPYHKNANYLNCKWREVARDLNMSDRKIRRKWKNLRDYYRLELKKCRNARRNPEHYESAWPYYECMKFLQYLVFASIDTRISEEEYQQRVLMNYGTDDPEAEQIKQEHDLIEEVEVDPLMLVTHDEESATGSGCASPQYDVGSEMGRSDDVTSTKRRRTDESGGNNDDMLFFRSLVPHLKDLPSLQKMKLRCSIQHLVLEAVEKYELDKRNQTD